MNLKENLVVVRGGGDIATGTIHALCRCGFPVLVLEIPNPSAIRRYVAFSEAVYDGESRVEDVTCKLVKNLEEAWQVMGEGQAAMLIDPECSVLKTAKPWALVDAIIAKKNLGTNRKMADRTIALGPGFCAGEDVDLVIETMRGHNLGRIIKAGYAKPNTGVPGLIAGFSDERVIHASHAGVLIGKAKIADFVTEGQEIAYIQTGEGDVPVLATISGLLRGLIRTGYPVTKGFKIADIDPRESEYNNCFTISDKARCIAGSVIEALLYLDRQNKCTKP